MARESERTQRYSQFAALLREAADRLGSGPIEYPTQADQLIREIQHQIGAWEDADAAASPPPDKGLGQLAGVGPEAAQYLGETRVPPGVEPYDDQVSAERLIAVADLYYIFQHEKIGVFRVVQ